MSESEETNHRKSNWRTYLVCLALILIAAVVLYVINATEPVAERETATLKRSMLVEVIYAEMGNYRPVIVETGTVVPAREVMLAPQVEGRVIKLHPDFNPGGFVRSGETVLQIEADDYKNRLLQRESELIQAETELAIEMGRQEVAQRDFELLGERLPEGEDTLVLREPQLTAAKTRIESAKAAYEQAKLDLARTELRAPFDAQILRRMADLGSQVFEGTPIAEIVGVEQYWVMATVLPSKLPYIDFPKGDAPGSQVDLVKRGGSGEKRAGRLFRLVGELESNTRLARVVIEVDDPLNLENKADDLPALLLGEFLEVRITGRELENVVRLPVDYVRKNDTTWVMTEEDKLEVRPLDIILRDSRYAYVKSGLKDGERIVSSNLSRVTEGADLRTADDNTDPNRAE